MTLECYIKQMAAASKTLQHELILGCLVYWDVPGVKDLTAEMAAEYWHHIENKEKRRGSYTKDRANI